MDVKLDLQSKVNNLHSLNHGKTSKTVNTAH